MEGGAYTGRFNSPNGHIKAMNFIEILEFLNDRVDNFPLDQFWDLVDTLSLDERKDKIKKQQKRCRKKYDKYNPSNLTRPKTAMNLFRVEYKKTMMSDGKKYNQEEFNKAWASISDAEKKPYVEQYNKLLKQYELDYDKSLKLAIINGEHEEHEPKKPLSTYMLFMSFCRLDNNCIVDDKLKDELKSCSLVDTTVKLSDLYKEYIKDEQNLKKLENARAQCVELYDYNYYHWKVANLQGRIKKCQREGKNITYLQKELNDYIDAVEFDTTTVPVINVDWVYKKNNNTIVNANVSSKVNKEKLETEPTTDINIDIDIIEDAEVNRVIKASKVNKASKASKPKSKPK